MGTHKTLSMKEIAEINDQQKSEWEKAASSKPEPIGATDEPIAWEAISGGVRKYVSDTTYRRFSPKIQKWYKPYKCSSCAQPLNASPKAVQPDPVAHIFPDDLERFATNETHAIAYSIAMASPTQGRTVELFTHPPLTTEQARLAAIAECADAMDQHFSKKHGDIVRAIAKGGSNV